MKLKYKPTKLHKEPLRICECLRCGEIWASRLKRPIVCSHCKSAYWDRPRKIIKKGGVKL